MIPTLIRRSASALARTLRALLVIAAVVAVAILLKVTFYHQRDDPGLLEGKRLYLERVRASALASAVHGPNVVVVLYDDLGYADLGITGSRAIATPGIDALAQDGVRLDHYYAPAPVCTPSRFGLLTGRFAERGGLSHVVFPDGHPMDGLQRLRGLNTRIPAHEITLAEVLRAAGYRTGMIGKWHLGDRSPSLPNDLGFEEFFGTLYSNDMEPLAWYRNREVEVSAPIDQTVLAQRYVSEADAFIARHAKEPFFLYLAHNFPHQPLHVAQDRLGHSQGGLYGDVVEEVDEGLARLVAALKQAGVYDNTLIVLSSDNGPWFQGSPGPVRGRKAETFEGGMHVPFIASWPAGGLCRGCVREGLAMGTDLLPTLLDMLQLPAPADRVLDGRSLLALLREGGPGPHDYLYYFSGELYAVRDARFKYMPRRSIAYPQAGMALSPGLPQGPFLFDLSTDPEESYDVSARYPADMQRLGRVYEEAVAGMHANAAGVRR